MQLLGSLAFHVGSAPKLLELFSGDLARMDPEDGVDVLVVSAFPGDYTPTPRSLIGALHGRGVSVAELARGERYDLRQYWASWLSAEVQGQGFRRVLCYEPGRGATSEHGVDAIFRAMAPFIGMKQGIRRVAMPVVGTGDQGGSQEAVLPSLLQAAYDALSNTALERIRLVEHDSSRTPALRQAFEAFKATHLGDLGPHGLLPREYDVFISYSTKWAGDADFVHDTLTELEPGIRIFQDAHRLEPGKDYRTQLDLAMRSSARVMTLYTPEYLESNACKDEFNTAWAIRTAADPDFLFPMFVRRMSNDGREIDASLDNDSRKTTTHYVQCIEADKAMMRHGCEKLLEGLTSGKPAMMI